MGKFSDYVQRYFESGLYTIPCGDKKQPLLGKEWQRFCDSLPTEVEVSRWEREYDECERLGLLLGEKSSVVAFDFDYEFNETKCKIKKSQFDKDFSAVEKQILALLPMTPCKKVGKKGWTAFYKWTPGLKNLSCDRNSVRLFDFLAWHKQTIIPPSLHSINDKGAPIYYKWVGTPIDQCVSELPEISLDIIEEIKLMFGDPGMTADNSRHGKLFKYILSIVAVESDKARIISSVVEKDKIINQTPYLSDLKHNASAEAKVNAEKWVDRILKWKKVTDENSISYKRYLDLTSWDYFFENSFFEMKKDIISQSVFIKKDRTSQWTPILALDGVLKSYANIKKLPYTQVNQELDRWIFEYQNLDFLCDIPKWDGIDRIIQICGSIKSSEFTPDECSDIFKQWGATIFKRVESEDNQNRCIIMKGPQRIGKDSLVKALLRDFKPYYEQTLLSGTPKDVLEIVSRLLAVHIEEFDQTRGLGVGFFKSLVTQSSSFFRESYAVSPTAKIMKPSYISTANVDDLFKDPTGNKRFIVIPINSIDWHYPQKQSSQVLAQWKHYYENGDYLKLKAETEAKIAVIIERLTPSDPDILILEVYTALATAISGNRYLPSGVAYLHGAEIAACLHEVAKINGCGIRKVQSVLKSRGLAKRCNDGTRYYVQQNSEIQ